MRTITPVRLLFLLLSIGASADAALLSRQGGQAYYDDVLDITWLANPDLIQVESFGVAPSPGPPSAGWTLAHDWLAAMNAANYLGASNWRLPSVRPVNGVAFNLASALNGSRDFGYNISAPGSAYPGTDASEMAHLFYNTLGNAGYFSPAGVSSGTCIDPGLPGTCLLNAGPFTSLRSAPYWAEAEPGWAGPQGWIFMFAFGSQEDWDLQSSAGVWAVRDGDIGEVPIPAALTLFGPAVAGLLLLRRRGTDSADRQGSGSGNLEEQDAAHRRSSSMITPRGLRKAERRQIV